MVLVSAQEGDKIENEILNYSDSESQVISKGRKLLTDSFIKGDIEKVSEIRDYLLRELNQKDYIALYPGEQWMILYWTGEFSVLVDSLQSFYAQDLERYEHKITPSQDQLYLKLVERSWEEIVRLERDIIDSSLDQETKGFLILHLNYMISGEPLNQITQQKINDIADLFLKKYPSGNYEEFVRNNIRFKFKASNWGFAFDFFGGYAAQTDELTSQFKNGFAIGHGFDIEYKRFSLFLRNYIGFSRTLQDMEFEGAIWEKDMQVRQFLPEASLGYAVLDNKQLKLSSFAGIGGVGYTPTESDIEDRPELDDVQIGFATALNIGANLDIKLKWNTGALLPNDKTYWFLRFRYGYTMPQMKNYPGYNGNSHYFNIGIGGVFRGTKRDL